MVSRLSGRFRPVAVRRAGPWRQRSNRRAFRAGWNRNAAVGAGRRSRSTATVSATRAGPCGRAQLWRRAHHLDRRHPGSPSQVPAARPGAVPADPGVRDEGVPVAGHCAPPPWRAPRDAGPTGPTARPPSGPARTRCLPGLDRRGAVGVRGTRAARARGCRAQVRPAHGGRHLRLKPRPVVVVGAGHRTAHAAAARRAQLPVRWGSRRAGPRRSAATSARSAWQAGTASCRKTR